MFQGLGEIHLQCICEGFDYLRLHIVSLRIKTNALIKQQTLNLSIISETNADIVKWDNTPLIKGDYWFESSYRYKKRV